jgi:hypothetical protein
VILGIAEFTVNSGVQAGQIPTDKPEVDIMWDVLPKEIVKHNFGNGIADNYYAIEVMIGNNSAYSLQIAGLGFQVPEDACLEALVERNVTYRSFTKGVTKLRTNACPRERARPNNSALLPTAGYRIARGSIEARHLLHPRTVALSVITALGPVLTGFVPFFHVLNRRANFSEGINILSNPLEKGIELVWPDPRPLQRERFEDQVLRDGMVIRNNTQVRTLAFFPKELVRLPENFENKADYKRWRDNPREIRDRLGDLVIIGDQIEFVNRVSFVANTSPIQAAPVLATLSDSGFVQGTTSAVTLTGENLHGALLSVGGTNEITFDVKSVDPTGRSVTALVTVDKTVPPGPYNLIIRTPNSTQSDVRQFVVDPVVFVLEEGQKVAFPGTTSDTVSNQLTITFKGTYLHNVRLRSTSDSTGIPINGHNNSPAGDEYSLTLTIPAGTKEGDYTFELFDPKNEKVKGKQVTVTLKK